MSTMSEEARSKAKSKAERLVRNDPHERVDASGYQPDGAMDADVQTGPRPISRRQFKRGGKVEGESAGLRADRKPRASGGGVNAYINRNVKSANEERDGIKHIGGMKSGGRAAHASGGKVHADAAQDKKLIHEMGCKCAKCSGGRVGHARGGPAINDGTRPVAGRIARKGGGRTKGKTNINIIVAPQGQGGPPPGPPPGAPPGGPVGLHQGAPPPAAMGPGVMPPGAPAPMMRKSGGRTGVGEGFGAKLIKPGAYPIETGAGGGLGRLEKAEKARPRG
jgi:hypothetical protein